MDYLRSFFISELTIKLENIYKYLNNKYNVNMVVEEIINFYKDIRSDLENNKIKSISFKDNALIVEDEDNDEKTFITKQNYSRVILCDALKKLVEEKVIILPKGQFLNKDKKIMYQIEKDM